MGRRVDVNELVGTAEIAARLGVGRSTVVHDWRYRHADFPQPVATLKAGLVWAWPDVAAWAKATGRKLDDTKQ
jgi:predicted DNA-binding transcriptional regulator AlpA